MGVNRREAVGMSPPRFVVWAGPLKSLRSVTVKPSPKPRNAGERAIIAGAVILAGDIKTTKIEWSTSGRFAPGAAVRGVGDADLPTGNLDE
jgi:hypothetical protein